MPRDALVFVGTYTRGGSEGIYPYCLDLATGALERLAGAGKVENPSFLAVAPNGRFLYAVSETESFAGGQSGAVSAFSLDPATGGLSLLNQQPSEGRGPCFVSVDGTGSCALVANYSGGSVAQLPIRSDGSLGPATGKVQHQGSSVDPKRQQGPYAHSIYPDPTNRFAFAVDLGLDQILCYRLDPKDGRLPPHDVPWTPVAPGAGPRHFAFHPNGRFGYAITEMGNTVVVFAYDAARGTLSEVQTVSTLPPDFTGTSYCAEVQLTPDGRFLYGSNRYHDSIAVFAVDGGTGRLSLVEIVPCEGKNPRHFGIDPTGSFLLAAGMESDSIAVFRIDRESGRLSTTGHRIELPSPVCVRFLLR
ncbi:MAG: lactonase family protein [Candidatus Latescibacterota bacterium]|jgi:6-phosphogluconolactonase